jgi:alanyl-tRNA synthetase
MKTAARYYDYESDAPFAARIVEKRPFDGLCALLLDQTIFYPEGGGQGADAGTINGAALVDVREDGEEILHLVSPADGARLDPGPATLVLDARRRRDLTVQHTAQHLLSGTLLAMTGAYTVSMHLGEEICTIDVDTPELRAEALIAVEEAVAAVIERDAPVIIHLCPPEDVADFPLRKTPPQGESVIRVVEIAGSDFSPCCGTHVPSTGRIGMLRILGAEKYKGMTRVSFIAGRRTLRDSRLLRENAGIVSRALKVPVAETGNAVLALLERVARLEQQVKEYAENAARLRAESLIAEAGLAAAVIGNASGGGRVFGRSFKNESIAELLELGRAAQKLTPAVLVFASEPDRKFAAFCAVKSVDLRPLCKTLMEAQGGRGGGGPGFFQGLFGSARDLARFMESLPNSMEAL